MAYYQICCNCGNAKYGVGGWYCNYYNKWIEGTNDGYGCPGWREKEEKNSGGSGSSGCFLTSACVNHLGKPDDCIELNTLRKFRDEYLLKTQEGVCLVKEYYAIAPQIVQKIDSSPNKNRYYDSIYATVCKCLECIRQNKPNDTIQAYKDMVVSLQKEFCFI